MLDKNGIAKRIAKEIKDLERYFASLEEMTKLPAAIFVVDLPVLNIAETGKNQLPFIFPQDILITCYFLLFHSFTNKGLIRKRW